MATYLKTLNEGKASIDVAKIAFGDLSKLDRDLDAYLNRGTLPYVHITFDDIAADAVKVRMLTPGEAAMMPVRLRSDRGVELAAAQALVLDARRLASPFPSDAKVQDVLAEAEYDAHNDDLAEAAADRALLADPQDRTAMMYKGRAIARRPARSAAGDPGKWKEARSWFIKANRLEPNDAAALLLYYESFLSEGIRPTPNAVRGLERAFELVPQDNELRLHLALQYLADGKLQSARTVLVPLAFDPHAPADNQARALIALIDKGDAAAIAAKLAKPSVTQ